MVFEIRITQFFFNILSIFFFYHVIVYSHMSSEHEIHANLSSDHTIEMQLCDQSTLLKIS